MVEAPATRGLPAYSTTGEVATALDRLPIGRFHAWHLLRQLFAWTALSSCQESTPSVLPHTRSLT